MSKPGNEDAGLFPSSDRARLDPICEQFEGAWKAGGRPRLEDYLVGSQSADRATLLSDLIVLDVWWRRTAAGEQPCVEEYLGRFTDLPPDRVMQAFQAGARPAQPADSNATTDDSTAAGCEETSGTTGANHPFPVIPGYEVLSELGRGGMGVVYKARHRRLGRWVALKVIRKDRWLDPDAIRRFEWEAKAAARLAHPNLVVLYDADAAGDTHFLAMECLDGTDLGRLVKRDGPLPISDACKYLLQACRGLQYAHERGLIHRDIKPANLMATTSDRCLKILDLGLARHIIAEELEARSFETPSGFVLGTPDFLAPEQALDARLVDPRSDIYSLGCTFYYLLTGQVPFPGGTIMQKLLRHREEEPLSMVHLRPELPRALVSLVAVMLAKRPEERPQTMSAVATILEDWIESSRERSPALAPFRREPAKAAVALTKSDLSQPPPLRRARNKPSILTPRWMIVVGSVLTLCAVTIVSYLFQEQGWSQRNRQHEGEFTNGLNMQFVLLGPGRFRMGSDVNETTPEEGNPASQGPRI
jgi:serine/threonine protein kinase